MKKGLTESEGVISSQSQQSIKNKQMVSKSTTQLFQLPWDAHCCKICYADCCFINARQLNCGSALKELLVMGSKHLHT